jgi:two-component system chemotaxis response regulator CheB
VVIGAGTGGPQALAEVLPRFPSTFSGTIIVLQQMRAGFTRVLANHLNDVCHLPVYEPVNGQELHASEILMIPGGFRLAISESKDGASAVIKLEDLQDDPEALRARIDKTMISLTGAFGRDTIGVLLTGMGEDGRDGMRAIADIGGSTIAQDEESSTIFDLPSCAIDSGAAHHVLPLWNIVDQIISIAGEANADAA